MILRRKEGRWALHSWHEQIQYPLYWNSQDFFVVSRIRDHHTKLPLVWGSLRLASIILLYVSSHFEHIVHFKQRIAQKVPLLAMQSLSLVLKPWRMYRESSPSYIVVEKGMNSKKIKGRTMMQALQQLRLANRHVTGGNGVEQWRIKPVVLAIS